VSLVLLDSNAQLFSAVVSGVITLSVIAVFAAILVDFVKYDRKNTVKKGSRSIVATGSMLGFYVVYYMVIRFWWGSLYVRDVPIILLGTGMVVAGAVINIVGRMQLKDNWANHIKIYDDHSLVCRGVYRVVRHPLYASLMLMLLGGSLAYRNWLSAALTILIFIPFVYYRARQEETLLQEEFPEYVDYQRQVGMFLPRLWGFREKAEDSNGSF
jgi:protein-S-isoprenylcysteine O-methyltransferase Ste14